MDPAFPGSVPQLYDTSGHPLGGLGNKAWDERQMGVVMTRSPKRSVRNRVLAISLGVLAGVIYLAFILLYMSRR